MRSKEVSEAIERMEKVKDKNLHTFVDELTTVLNYISELENKLKQAKEYINEEMYVDYNVTFSSEEDFYNDLPCSLNLHNEDLRKLLDMLEN